MAGLTGVQGTRVVRRERMPYTISRLGTVEIRSLDLDRDLDYYLNVLGCS